MTLHHPPEDPTSGDVRLRPFQAADTAMLQDLATDPYLPLIGSLPAHATEAQALAYIERQRGRLTTGAGYSFCIADLRTGAALGTIGLHLKEIASGRAGAGYAVAPRSRGRHVAGQALRALTNFAWTIPELHRIELLIEPWNAASIGTATGAGFEREGLLRSHQEIGGHRVDMLLYAAVLVR